MKVDKKKKKIKTSDGSSKKAKRIAREEKAAKRKGDGSFPDVLVVTKEKVDGNEFFLGHDTDLATLVKDGSVVAVYKLRRVSTISIKRKVVR